MKEIYINADDYNSDSIKTIQGNNNAEEYKIYLQYDNEKIDLTGKTVNLGFLRVGSTEGDIIENLNVTNPKEGEITLKITNKISKRNGTYSCQLAILGEGDFLEHTATFTLTVENNIFSDITKAIADSKDFTYLENILDKASKLNEKLKENTSSATNANSNLESNITEANNINSKLLENTSTATSLNKNLESNIDLAKEVKETIKDLDTKNIEATEKIETLTGLNAKATELSNNIQQGLPLNSELVKNVESAKVANTNLLTTNQEAVSKNTELQASLEKTKEFIDGLDGSQNIPGIRMELTELQNGLKSNQALGYEGSSIVANETLEGRTEGMRIKGRSLLNLIKDGKGTFVIDKNKNQDMRIYTFKLNHNLVRGKKYVGYIQVNSMENVTSGLRIYGWSSKTGVNGGYFTCANNVGVVKFKWNTSVFPENVGEIDNLYLYVEGNEFNNGAKLTFSNFMLFEEGTDLTYIDEYFEGLKSFGEAEKEGDKYKISILSSGKNIFKGYNQKIKLEQGKTYVFSSSKTEGAKRIYISNINKDDIETRYFYWSDNMKRYHYNNDVDILNNITIKCLNSCEIVCLKGDIEYLNIQLEEGVQSTKYETYKEDKKYILIKAPLRSVGNISDVVYEDDGQVKVCRNTYKYTFTGNEPWQYGGESSNKNVCLYLPKSALSELLPNCNFDVEFNNNRNVISNNLLTISRANLSDTSILQNNDCISINFNGINLNISSLSNYEGSSRDVEKAKEWLKANPIEIIYLTTPTIEIVENCIDIDLDTFQDKTYFNILNSLPGTLDFKVPSNIGSVVQNMAKEVNNIWDVINNLLVPSIVKANGNIAMIKLNNNLK